MAPEDTIKVSTCPTCGSRNVKKVTQSVAGTYRGRKYTVPEVEFFACHACGEKIYGRQAIREIEACYLRPKSHRRSA